MEYEKQIEIKIDGNNCIINIPQDQNISSKSLNKILAQNNNSLTNIDDISFSVSVTLDENMNSKNDFYNNKNNINNNNNNINNNNNNNNNILYSNEKSKLEITYQSIFYSDLKSESSNMKTPLLLLNSKNNIETQQKKDSVVKRLNFDLSNSNNSKNNISNSNSNYSYMTKNNTTNEKNELSENVKKINSEIQNINVKKLPLINRNNIVKNISKNLNKEYFIHEKIYLSNKNNEKDPKKMERIKLDKKMKENSIKNSNKSRTNIINKSYIKANNNEMPNINNHQVTDNIISKVKSNFLNKNKINQDIKNTNGKIHSNFLLYKCSSKPNISNMKVKLNNILKLNSKADKENLNTNINKYNTEKKLEENIIKKNETEIKLTQRMEQSNNINDNDLISNEKEVKEEKDDNKKIYPRLTSAVSFNNSMKNTSIKSYNSYNKSAKKNKLKKLNTNTKNNPNNTTMKTPSIINKQIILSTPQTNSYSCSTSFSAKNDKSPNTNYKNYFENKSSDIKIENNNILKNIGGDPILSKIEAHNSLLKNFFLNPNNIKNQEKSDEYLNTNNNNITNYKGSDKKYEKDFLDESINNNLVCLRKFNTDLKIPLMKNKQMALMTERNYNNNYYNNNHGYQLKYNNANDLQKLFKKNEFDMELLNSIKK